MTSAGSFDFNFLRAVEVFVAVAEARHLTRAAEMLGLTQSAVSQHLKNLETGLEAQLVDRSRRPVELTKAGIALHRRAVTILAEVEQLRADVRRVTAAPLPMLRVAMLASIATTLAPVLAELARKSFGIPEISFLAGLSSQHASLLRGRRADLAITSDAFFDLDGLTRHHVLSEQFLLVTPRGYPGPFDDLEELSRRLPFVRFSRETPVGVRIDQHLRRVRLELPRSFEGDRSSVVMAPVAAGLAFTLLTPTLLIDGLAEGMEIDIHRLPIAGFAREITLVARERELGELPQVVAARVAAALAAAFEQRLPELPAGSYRIAGPNADPTASG
jgi:DNA-binding transcriptional LysR family regulator